MCTLCATVHLRLSRRLWMPRSISVSLTRALFSSMPTSISLSCAHFVSISMSLSLSCARFVSLFVSVSLSFVHLVPMSRCVRHAVTLSCALCVSVNVSLTALRTLYVNVSLTVGCTRCVIVHFCRSRAHFCLNINVRLTVLCTLCVNVNARLTVLCTLCVINHVCLTVFFVSMSVSLSFAHFVPLSMSVTTVSRTLDSLVHICVIVSLCLAMANSLVRPECNCQSPPGCRALCVTVHVRLVSGCLW